MSPALLLQVIAGIRPDTGRSISCELDTNDSDFDPIVLTGFTKWRHERITVAAAVTDQAYTFTEAVGLIVFSSEPISWRLVAAQALVERVRFFGWVGDTALNDVHSTSVLLTNPGTETAHIDVIVIEKA